MCHKHTQPPLLLLLLQANLLAATSCSCADVSCTLTNKTNRQHHKLLLLLHRFTLTCLLSSSFSYADATHTHI
jgi:hypothetical protein